jgi:hypothetical protein
VKKEEVTKEFKLPLDIKQILNKKQELEDEIIKDYKELIRNVNKAIDVHSSYKTNYKINRKTHIDEMIEILKVESTAHNVESLNTLAFLY